LVPTKRARYAARDVPGAYNAIWGDLQRCIPFPQLAEWQLNSMYKQMVCHTLWGVGKLGGKTWDFESWRPDISYWKALRVDEHSCNWDKSAQGWTSKCVETKPGPTTCVRIHGGGLLVNQIQLGVRLNSKQTSYGHWQVWAPGFPANTDELLLKNPSLLGQIVWGPVQNYNRAFRHGESICAKWWRNDRPGSGHWSDRGQVCLDIHR